MTRVLVVDDSAVDRRLAGRLLEKNSDFTISYANDGAEACGTSKPKSPTSSLPICKCRT